MTFLFDNTIVVKRMKATSGNKRSLVSTATGETSIQPMGRSGEELSDGVFGTSYVAYVDENLDVQKGDRVTDSNGEEYDVEEIILRNLSMLPHKQVILKKSS